MFMCFFKMKILILALTIAVVSCCSPKPPESPKNGERCAGAGEASITTASGTKAPVAARYCKGDVIFEENFNELNEEIWKHEETLSGGPNQEFQWSTNDRLNSFTYNGFLYLNPTLTEKGLSIISGIIDISKTCTTLQLLNGCKRTGSSTNVLNPIRSAAIQTSESFSFRYGILEIRAKMPSGDWLRPSIWLLPKVVGSRKGVIVVESRGNKILLDKALKDVGSSQIKSSTPTKSHTKTSLPGFDDGLHTYKFIWTKDSIQFSVDGVIYSEVDAVKLTQEAKDLDEDVYLLMNLGVGGNNFGDNIDTSVKPWIDDDPLAATAFWNQKDKWLTTWDLDNPNKPLSLIVDYVKVTAV